MQLPGAPGGGGGGPAGSAHSMGPGGLPKRPPDWISSLQKKREGVIASGIQEPTKHAPEHMRKHLFMQGNGHDIREDGPTLAQAPGKLVYDPGIYDRTKHDQNLQPVHQIDPNVVRLRTKEERPKKRFLL